MMTSLEAIFASKVTEIIKRIKKERWKVVPLDSGDAENNIPKKKKSMSRESPSKRPRRSCRGPE